VRAQFLQRRCRTSVGRYDRCDHALAQSIVGDPEHRAFSHRGMCCQRRLHQLRQHGQPAGADRVIDSALLQIGVGKVFAKLHETAGGKGEAPPKLDIDPVGGEEVERLMGELFRMPPPVLAKLKELLR